MNDGNTHFFSRAIFSPNNPKRGETSEIASGNISDSKNKTSVHFKEKIDFLTETEIVTLENGLQLPEPIKKVFLTDESLKKPPDFNNRHSVFQPILDVFFFGSNF